MNKKDPWSSLIKFLFFSFYFENKCLFATSSKIIMKTLENFDFKSDHGFDKKKMEKLL